MKTLTFDGGDPVFATSNQPYDRMGDMLYREGKIGWDQYLRCQNLLVETGRRMGSILVERGLIKPRELFPLVRRHVAEIIYSLFAWTDGEYELGYEEPLPDEKIKLDLNTAAITAEGVRRKYGLDRLLELVGPPETRLLALPAASGLAMQAGLGVRERKALELMDGRRTLQEVASAAGLEELGAYQLAYAAMAIGAAALRGAGEARVVGDESAGAALAREEGIDRQRIEAKYAQVMEADYFTILGLAPDASAHEVLRGYQRTREEFRSDAFPAELGAAFGGQLEEIVEVIDEAYRVLGDEELRRSYRETLA